MGNKAVRGKDEQGNIYYYCPYFPVGSLYLSVTNVNPSQYFGGTWEQVKADAYLKIVSSNGGNLGGTSSDHKIPIASMPSHNHNIYRNDGGDAHTMAWGVANYNTGYLCSQGQNPYKTQEITNTGGGEAYYPYYLGIYVWKRTA